MAHSKGLLFTDMPDSHPQIIGVASGYTIAVSHEILQMQKFSKENCVIDPNYKLDECRFDYIKKVKFIIDIQNLMFLDLIY